MDAQTTLKRYDLVCVANFIFYFKPFIFFIYCNKCFRSKLNNLQMSSNSNDISPLAISNGWRKRSWVQDVSWGVCNLIRVVHNAQGSCFCEVWGLCVCVTYRNVTRDTLLRQAALPIVWGGVCVTYQ